MAFSAVKAFIRPAVVPAYPKEYGYTDKKFTLTNTSHKKKPGMTIETY